MAEFMLHHTHPAEECENIFPQLQNVAQSLKGKNFFCTCPSGDHGGSRWRLVVLKTPWASSRRSCGPAPRCFLGRPWRYLKPPVRVYGPTLAVNLVNA